MFSLCFSVAVIFYLIRFPESTQIHLFYYRCSIFFFFVYNVVRTLSCALPYYRTFLYVFVYCSVFCSCSFTFLFALNYVFLWYFIYHGLIFQMYFFFCNLFAVVFILSFMHISDDVQFSVLFLVQNIYAHQFCCALRSTYSLFTTVYHY